MSKTIQKIISFCLALIFIAICVSGCADKDAKTEEKASPSKEKITMEKLIATNHPDARLEKADSFLLERSGDNEYLLYLDKEGTLLESFPHEETFRLTVDLSYDISKIGESYERNTVSYVSPEEEWYPFLLFPSSLSLREKIVGQEEKDGKILLTTRLSGWDYDASLNQEENITERCETVYVIEKESLQILSYETVVFLIDGSCNTLHTKITENAEKPAAAELLIAYYESLSTNDDPEQEEIEDGNEPSDSPDSSDSSSSGSSSSAGSNEQSGANRFYKNDNEMNILLIGNSYSYYWTEELWGLLNAAGYKNISVCNVYYSGCTFEQHWTWHTEGESNYTFFTVTDKHNTIDTKIKKSAVNLKYCLNSKVWDVISLQQSNKWAGSETGHRNSITPYIPQLYQLLHDHSPNAEFYWQQDWAHEIGKDSITAKSTQEKHTRVFREVGLEFCRQYGFTLVPLGEAWPLVRHNSLFYEIKTPVSQNYPTKSLHTRIQHQGTQKGKIINTDLSHDGDIGGGQYLNACVWFEILTNSSVIGNNFRPFYSYQGQRLTLSEDQISALQEAAHTAVENSRKNGYIF